MKYISTLLVVKNIELSKAFYHDVLGMTEDSDFGSSVTLSGGITLQTEASWLRFIERDSDAVKYGNCASEVYFEEKDIEAFARKLETDGKVELIHPLKEHRWGQRIVRFYDPDRHIIEVAEPLDAVVWRLHDEGLTPDEIADRMDVFVFYVRSVLSGERGK